MKNIYFLFLLTFYLLNLNVKADTALVDTANLVNDSFAQIKKIGVLDMPCKQFMALDPEFSTNGANDACSKFIKIDGTLGPWGESIIKSIDKLPEEETKKTYLSNSIPDMDFICPNFKNFDNEIKKKFWVWTFASIAWKEATCNPKITAQGVNSKAVGLLQLEDSRRLRSGRGDNCEVSEVISPGNNLACGVEILHQQLLGKDSTYFTTSTGELFWKGTYWQDLRYKKRTQEKDQSLISRSQAPSNKKTEIKELVMRFPLCR